MTSLGRGSDEATDRAMPVLVRRLLRRASRERQLRRRQTGRAASQPRPSGRDKPGDMAQRLAEHLNNRGLTIPLTARKPANPVSVGLLQTLLRNPYYKAVISFQGVEYAGAHEPLVDAATWQTVQDILTAHTNGERQRMRNHHLKTTVYCGLCGARLLVQNTRNSKGDLYPYFICARRQRTHDCAFLAVLIDVVEEQMKALYRTIQLSRQDRQLVEQYVREELRHLERDKDRTIRSLTTRRTNIEDKRRRLMHAHYEGAVPLELLREE